MFSSHIQQVMTTVTNSFKKFNIPIKFSNLCTINDNPPRIHHNFSSLDRIYQHFTLCFDILIDVKPTKKICWFRKHNIDDIHQSKISITNNDL